MNLKSGIRGSGVGIRGALAILVTFGVLAGSVMARPAQAPLAVEGLPAQLSDADFWRLVGALSEP